VERIITRLGGGFSGAGELNEASMERTVEAIGTLADLSRRERVEKTFAVGTGVLRAAGNQREFLEKVKQRTSIILRVLSGEEEARLMLEGVLWSLPDKTLPRLVVDIGGWSTEILWVEGEVPRETVSLELGVVALAERFLKRDPPLPGEVEALEIHTRKLLEEIRARWEGAGRASRNLHPYLVGTAGTATTLAAIDQGLTVYHPQKISGHLLSLAALRMMYLRLRSLSSEERLGIPGLEKGREDLIVAGAAILISLLEVFDLPVLEVIDSGLLEGVLLERMKAIADRGLRNAD
jgi:exopolyphosphatase/guanosine-5'-triphosphate,3'-diphosphate pyrophosphatase